jgi:hypothetical protein
LLDVLKDGDTQAAIASVAESLTLEKAAEKVLGPKEGTSGKADEINWDDYVHKDSLIKCSKCASLLHIRHNIKE